jgi:multidrug efflux system outer membrane protein
VHTKFIKSVLLLVTTGMVVGCASTYRSPRFELPVAQTDTAPAALDQWWQSFNDPALTALVAEALAHNADVLTAMQTVEQSKSSLRQAQLTLLPDVNADLTATRQRSSNYTALPGQTGVINTYRGGFSASYELDLWGRAWNAKNAVAAQLLASRYARETTRSTVAAQTAKSYFALLALDAELESLTQTRQTRSEALVLQNKRYEVGASGDYELQQSQAELAAIDTQLPSVLAAREQAEASLAVLLGRSPKEIVEGRITRTTTLAALAATPEIPAGLSADLLTRRPDVRQAEAQLVAADASLKETRRRYFPSLSLTGFFGGESFTLPTLLDSAARSWSAAATLSQSVIGLAKTNAQVHSAKAAREQAELAYAQAARNAYADTRGALASHLAARDVLIASTQRRDNQNRVKAITEMRYKSGAASYLDLLNAERDRLSAENDQVKALQDRLDAMVNVYQALGGGWSAADLVK